MFRKFIAAFAAVFALSVCSAEVFALDDNLIYREIGIFAAQVYVCDDSENTVVLKSVKPLNGTREEISIASDAEYTELPVNPNMICDKNGFVYPSTVNAFLLDKTARVVIGRNNYGLKVLYIRF